MAQANQENAPESPREERAFKLNAEAPAFVPRNKPQTPFSGYFYPFFHFLDGGGSDWYYLTEQEPIQLVPGSPLSNFPKSQKNFLSDDLRRKIIKQVEYQFSDASLIANDAMMKIISKDPEGFVPISFVAASKRVKPLINNNQMLAAALRGSSKLVVSDDGKRVKRRHLFTERDKEELQSRIVVVENLPEDYSHKNMEKIFSVAGSVKNVRICNPQESNTPRSSNKPDLLISNKLHALVEFETSEQAEKSVEMLNDERNWRKGLRVRLLLRRSPRSVMRSKKWDFDQYDISEDDEAPPAESAEDSPRDPSSESNGEESSSNPNSSTAAPAKKGWGRGARLKGGGRGLPTHGGRGVLSPSPLNGGALVVPQPESAAVVVKPAPRRPRMPDGTRGFTMGRGKPAAA